MINYIFGKRIKESRKQKKLTQQKLANLLYVSKSTICSYEKGTRMAAIDTLIKLSNIFNLDINFLIGIENSI